MGKVKIEDLKMFFKAKVDTYLKFAKEYSKKGEYSSDIFSLSELLDDFTLGSDYCDLHIYRFKVYKKDTSNNSIKLDFIKQI